MTRKDYVLLAEAIAGAFPVPENSDPVTAWKLTRDAIAGVLQRDNPRFDRGRFERACAAGGYNALAAQARREREAGK